jgi:hypothetical protein
VQPHRYSCGSPPHPWSGSRSLRQSLRHRTCHTVSNRVVNCARVHAAPHILGCQFRLCILIKPPRMRQGGGQPTQSASWMDFAGLDGNRDAGDDGGKTRKRNAREVASTISARSSDGTSVRSELPTSPVADLHSGNRRRSRKPTLNHAAPPQPRPARPRRLQTPR